MHKVPNPNYMVQANSKKYRIVNNYSQAQMAAFFGITQSHYSKIEHGTKILSFTSLKRFVDSGHDAFQIITGEPLQNGYFDHYWDQCTSIDARIAFLEISTWIVGQGLRLSQQPSDRLYKTQKLVTLLLHDQHNNNIWKSIREVENLTQMQMVACLDINIKKYRHLEKGIKNPDAPTLTALYNNLHYYPIMLMEKQTFCIHELNLIWNSFETPIQELLSEYVKKGWQLATLNISNPYEKEHIDTRG